MIVFPSVTREIGIRFDSDSGIHYVLREISVNIKEIYQNHAHSYLVDFYGHTDIQKLESYVTKLLLQLPVTCYYQVVVVERRLALFCMLANPVKTISFLYTYMY